MAAVSCCLPWYRQPGVTRVPESRHWAAGIERTNPDQRIGPYPERDAHPWLVDGVDCGRPPASPGLGLWMTELAPWMWALETHPFGVGLPGWTRQKHRPKRAATMAPPRHGLALLPLGTRRGTSRQASWSQNRPPCPKAERTAPTQTRAMASGKKYLPQEERGGRTMPEKKQGWWALIGPAPCGPVLLVADFPNSFVSKGKSAFQTGYSKTTRTACKKITPNNGQTSYKTQEHGQKPSLQTANENRNLNCLFTYYEISSRSSKVRSTSMPAGGG